MTPETRLDPRATPATDRVALSRLRGVLDRPEYTDGTPARVAVPLTDLNRTPSGTRERQLLHGTGVTVIETRDGWSFVEDENGYCGWVAADALGPMQAPTHRVAVPATQIYPSPDFKQRATATLSLGARVTVLDSEGRWARIAQGYIPAAHLDAAPAPDPVAVAALLLGTPYVWGGNSRDGIDCSGLVQLSLNAAGIACPGDSDQQQALGGAAEGAYQRGDLLFWPGHVAMAMNDTDMIHATAYGMTVRIEPIQTAIARIEAAGDGPLTAVRRL